MYTSYSKKKQQEHFNAAPSKTKQTIADIRAMLDNLEASLDAETYANAGQSEKAKTEKDKTEKTEKFDKSDKSEKKDEEADELEKDERPEAYDNMRDSASSDEDEETDKTIEKFRNAPKQRKRRGSKPWLTEGVESRFNNSFMLL